MDDNYSSELAALERLAQAEEAERQRVMSKLDVWKAALTEYETAHEVWVSDKSGDWAIHERYVDARDHIEGNAPDYLRTLIAVAEAAAEYKRDGGYEPMAKLFDALKALE